jgi:hypothetical protein
MEQCFSVGGSQAIRLGLTVGSVGSDSSKTVRSINGYNTNEIVITHFVEKE